MVFGYVFKFIEECLDGCLIFILIDEVWLFVMNLLFFKCIEEWLCELCCKNVVVVLVIYEICDFSVLKIGLLFFKNIEI